VLTSNYQAEYGRSGGGVIALNHARRHQRVSRWRPLLPPPRQHGTPTPSSTTCGRAGDVHAPSLPLQFLRMGFGGPVYIPHVVNGKNKLFFFASQEYYSQLVPQASSVNILVPTAAERTGRLLTLRGRHRQGDQHHRFRTRGLAFPGNIIPSSRIYAAWHGNS